MRRLPSFADAIARTLGRAPDARAGARAVPIVFAEPWWIGALAVLVLNDFVFKRSPVCAGWITGKASDFAILVVAPPLLAAALRARSRGAIAACHLAFALLFSAIKTSHAISALFVEALSFIHARNTVDPTDLIALSVLPFAFWRTDRAARRVAPATPARKKGELVLAIVGALGCVADQPPHVDDSEGGGGSGGATATTSVQVAAPASTGGFTASCTDGVRDGTETGADCGGGSCKPCGEGDDCVADTDCTTGRCDAGSCASCMFDSQCGDARRCDVDAGGVCKPRGGNGQHCAEDDACSSGHCSAGTCCDQACGGSCESCLAAFTGKPSDGVCGAVLSGLDPKGACEPSACETGACDGAGACGFVPSGTACAAMACANDAIVASQCDASHACIPSSTPCPNHLGCFGATECALGCGFNGIAPSAVSAGCAAGYFCDATLAVPACVAVKKAAGAACVNDYECAGGSCVGGHCN